MNMTSVAAPAEDVLRPHTPLADYYGSEVEHQSFLRKIFDDTAADYDRIERVLALGTGARYRREALVRAGLHAGDDVLDVGIGTGLVAREALALIGPGGSLVGVDPSAGMMAEAALPGAEMRAGEAGALPVADESCDFLSMGYALRHVPDVTAAFAEFHRALRPGGRLMILEITKPAGPVGALLLKTYMRAVVPFIAAVVSRRRGTAKLWRYYWDTIEACIPPQSVVAALEAAGFTAVKRHVELGMFSEYTAIKIARPARR